jgi:hypothetical protein
MRIASSHSDGSSIFFTSLPRQDSFTGPIVWGARTLRGDDMLSDDYKYVPVRRLTLFIEESLYRGTKFAVFEPNDDTLWSQLRLSIGTFMADLERKGAFYGYQVTCDKTTTTADDIQRGIVNAPSEARRIHRAAYSTTRRPACVVRSRAHACTDIQGQQHPLGSL